MSDICKHGIRDTVTNLPYCKRCDDEGKAHSLHRPGSAAAWRNLAMRLADEATTVLDNAHWEVKHGSGDLLTTIKAVREKYRLETQMPPNEKS
jgi:hypothetical protein